MTNSKEGGDGYLIRNRRLHFKQTLMNLLPYFRFLVLLFGRYLNELTLALLLLSLVPDTTSHCLLFFPSVNKVSNAIFTSKSRSIFLVFLSTKLLLLASMVNSSDPKVVAMFYRLSCALPSPYVRSS